MTNKQEFYNAPTRQEEYKARFALYLSMTKLTTHWAEPTLVEPAIQFHPERGWQFTALAHWPKGDAT